MYHFFVLQALYSGQTMLLPSVTFIDPLFQFFHEHLEDGNDRVERGSQLVGHRGKEMLFDLLSLFLNSLEGGDVGANNY
jgi:hypothetical protein